MLQLSDKSGGRDFEESDETNIHALAALIGSTRYDWPCSSRRSRRLGTGLTEVRNCCMRERISKGPHTLG
jgi:hypothetical protein